MLRFEFQLNLESKRREGSTSEVGIEVFVRDLHHGIK